MDFILTFPEGMPKATAQQKGETIKYKNGRPYIQHYTKSKVASAQSEFIRGLKKYAPGVPYTKPIRLFIGLYFDIKDRSKWSKPKTTRPDVDNYCKALIDCMVSTGYFKDDAQVTDIRITKSYAEHASIYIRIEEIK